VPDPENYTIVFRPDGQLEVRADCNSGIATYTLEDKRLTLELGPMTSDIGPAASCGEESLHDQYLQLLSQVSGYRWEDGWLVLILGDEAGRMIFNHGGPAE
jgi:heat shock protein HslJ